MPNTPASTILGNETSKIQNALSRAGVPIDLANNAGLNTVMVVDSVALAPEYPYDDIEMSNGDPERGIRRIETNIKAPDSKSVLVFEPGDQRPRILFWDKAKNDYEVSKPIDNIQKPKRPSLWHRLSNFFTGNYQDEIDEFDVKNMLYEKAQAALQNTGYKKALSERSKSMRMYPHERKAAEEKAVNAKEWQKEHELNQERINASLGPISYIKDRLDGMYKLCEENNLGTREDFTVIEGKPLHALMYEEYVQAREADSAKQMAELGKVKNTFMTFKAYCRKNPDRPYEMIAAALANGKAVYNYVPDEKTGICPTKPIKFDVHKDVITNFDKYKDQLPKLPEMTDKERYAKMEEVGDSINKLTVQSSANNFCRNSLATKKAMFGDVVLTDIPNPLGFTTGRSALSSFTYAYLVNEKNLPIKDLLDPNKYLEEKAAAGKLIMQKCEEGDQKWFAEQEILGRKKIVKDVVQHLEQMEYKDSSEVLEEKNRWVLGASEVLFDLDQEEAHIKPGIAEVIADPNKPEITQDVKDHISQAANGICCIPKCVAQGEELSNNVKLGFMDFNTGGSNEIFVGKLMFDYLKDRVAKNPGKLESTISSKDTLMGYSPSLLALKDKNVDKMLKGDCKTDLEVEDYQRKLCRFAENGGFEKNFAIKFLDDGDCDLVSKPNTVEIHKIKDIVKANDTPTLGQ